MHPGFGKHLLSGKKMGAKVVGLPETPGGVARVYATMELEVPGTGGRRPKTRIQHLEVEY